MFEDLNNRHNNFVYEGFDSLMREIQMSLYRVARMAESKDEALFDEINKEADIALRLLDSYQLASKVSCGQLSLEINPTGVGSLVHEVAYEIKSLSGSDIEMKIDHIGPVSANGHLLKDLIFAIGIFMAKSSRSSLKFWVYKADSQNTGLAVTSKDFDISNIQLKDILTDQKRIMSLPKISTQNNVMLILANMVAQTMNTELSVKKIGKSKGFTVLLPKSQQMSLV